MAKNRDKLARLLGAKVKGRVPRTGGGAFGMSRLAHVLHQRLTPGEGQRPGRPTDASWAMRPKIPMSPATQARLKELARRASASGRKVTAMQLAAHLLEEAVAHLEAG